MKQVCLTLLMSLSAALAIAGTFSSQDPASSPNPDDLEQGKRLYVGHCAVCHGIEGTGGRALSGDKAYGDIRALEVETGKLRWEFRLKSPPWAGVL